MKKDLTITTGVAAALLLSGCGGQRDDWTAQRDTAVCTDRAGNRVPDDRCDRRSGTGHGGGFLWYYLGRNRAIPAYGERATGGSWSRPAGSTFYRAPASTAMTRAAAVSRGGFGSSAHRFGSIHA
ncbi:hypothetical protein [uncultured Sphingomonas sp.]|uniref:hypothetical protein n=1 Tax=uncultured Sphingomonas sp. TaxID=158754 RepID=UPI00258DAAF6|nr:hypothetical protein [uncultured Sphingomonas sp.]